MKVNDGMKRCHNCGQCWPKMTVFGNAMTVGLRNHVMVNGDDRAPQPCDEVCGDGRAPLPVHGMAYDGAPLPDGDCPDGRASQLQPGECGGAQAGALCGELPGDGLQDDVESTSLPTRVTMDDPQHGMNPGWPGRGKGMGKPTPRPPPPPRAGGEGMFRPFPTWWSTRGSSIDLSGWSSLWEECQWWDTVKGSLVWTTPSSSPCGILINQLRVSLLNHQ